MDTLARYEAKKRKIVSQFKEIRAAKGSIALGKKTSNLFRTRDKHGMKLDVRDLDQVISVDVEKRVAVVEGMCPFERFTRETLKYGLLPAVVPELKTITIGGGVSGGAIEASSFRYGLVHETVEEMELLLGDGSVVVASRTNTHKDLFYGIANSYGTLGYILKLTVRLVPAKKFVKLTHTRFTEPKKYFTAMKTACGDKANAFVDGTVFSGHELYLTTGRFTDTVPLTSSYTYRKMYFRSIQEKTEDYLTAYDYIWRWDKDWFWCSKHFGMHRPVVRLTAGLVLRGSRQYWKIMQWNRKHRWHEKLRSWQGKPAQESVIQDVQIPFEGSEKFLRFFLKDVKISPVWICPTTPQKTPLYPLYEMTPGKLYLNFGFWDVVPLAAGEKNGHYNSLVENMVAKLHGRKGLYSDAYYDPKDFWKHYNKKAYDVLKKKYDPGHAFKGLYEKTVLRR